MKKVLTIILLFFICNAQAQRSDGELNRDSVVGWKYISNPINPKAVYKPIKSQYGGTYSIWQQQASDILVSWIQQSYLPRGLAMRTIAKNDERWYVDGNGPLHSYGVNFLGYSAMFVQGKIDLRCCEQGQRLVAGFNDFPGAYIKGFNPGGMYFFAEQASFSGGEDDAKLSGEGVDKKIQPNVYAYRTYLDHYHDNGSPFNKIGVVVAKNGEWPFKPVLVKDAIAFFNQQLAAYPDLLKYDYDHRIKEINAAIERLKPYYNEPAKIKNRPIDDQKGHSALSPVDIINGKNIDKTFPEYFMLVSATQQTIDQTNKDAPLWVYFNLTPTSYTTMKGNLSKFDTKFGTGNEYLINALVNNLNFDYIAKWLSQPEAMKNIAYTPANAPAKTSGNTITAPATVSATSSSKNKDPFTILYEDFAGYPVGPLSANGWHTFGYNGNSFENATLNTVNGQSGKWVSIPDVYTFYPDLAKPLPASFTVNYAIFFSNDIKNKRTPIYFRLDTKDPNPKKSAPIDLKDLNRSGFQFALALSGETETSKRYMDVKYDETIGRINMGGLKPNEVSHVSISVNGATVAVTVNGKELMRDDNALPVGKSFKRMGWYCGVPGIGLSNIYVKSSTAVQQANTKEPQFAGVVKDKEDDNGSSASTFESTSYVPQSLPKLDALPQINYPAGFKSAMPALAVSINGPAFPVKTDYKFPEKSVLLNSISNTITADAFKKLIADIAVSASGKLQKENTIRIDSYLKTIKATTSAAISKLALDKWVEGKPTAALYLFCKAVQADYTDVNTANNLASLLNAYGYSEKAIPVLQYINKQKSGEPAVLANMANAYYNLGDFSTANGFAQQAIAKDSLNPLANKIAAYNHLNKAQKNNDKAEAARAIENLKQSLKGKFDNEASNMLGKIESNHNTLSDFHNTNFKEFSALKKMMMPAMPTDLHQTRDFNRQMELEKSSIMKTADEVDAAINKIPAPKTQKNLAQAISNVGIANVMVKATSITSDNVSWYAKMKKDLEDIFIQNKKALTLNFNKKANAAVKQFNDQLKKLEGGEGHADEEIKIENLQKARCEAWNREAAVYLSDVAKLTNSFAQQSEYVSRIYWRDYANWAPYAQLDYSYRPFLTAQRGYLKDVESILSKYNAIEPCIYPTGPMKEDNTPAKPKTWEEKYCSNFKGTLGVGPAKIAFNCNSYSVSGGEGILGEMSLNYNEDGTFKDITIGAGLGAEMHWGSPSISAISAGASAMEYISIGQSKGGGIEVTDWGMTTGVGASTNVLSVGGEVNVLSGKISAQSGVTVEGVAADALNLNKKLGLKNE